MENDQDEVPTAPVSVWIGLILMAAVSFWCQAVITEERFVPALNEIAHAYNIPDDIAGATLMAAGASSPELFSSIVALFITHSSLGLGTIVGSEIFNQLIICTGAVYAAKSGRLQLDVAIVTREVSFYALGILLLYVALRDTEPDSDDESGVNHIYISFWEACMVFAGYLGYVWVCANMDFVVKTLSGRSTSTKAMSSTEKSENYGSIHRISMHVPNLPFLQDKALAGEPVGNFETVQLDRTASGGKRESVFDGISQNIIAMSTRVPIFSDGGSTRQFNFLMQSQRPTHERGLYEMESNTFDERMNCFLWQKSYFYSNAKFAMNGWNPRWFTFTRDRVYSVPDRYDADRHRMSYPSFTEVEIDTKRLLIKLTNPKEPGRDYLMMAPSEDIMEAVVEKLGIIIESNLKKAESKVESPEDEPDDPEFDSSDDFEDLTQFPVGGNIVAIVLFCCLFPLKFLMQYTCPDVRKMDRAGNPTSTLSMAWLAILSCLGWLVVGSYAMVASLENLAALMDIPDAVVGVTVSAAGTSLPNYVASKVAAQNGFGNMAVSNAFGSNTFNIMVGLGLPWVLYTSFGTGFEPYHGLRDEGITQSVMILASVLLVFVVFMLQSGFVLLKWHGIVFALMYIAYLVFAIGQVYL